MKKRNPEALIPKGLSRFSDTYRDLGLKYGERVRLEQSLSHKDVTILDFISKKDRPSLTQIQEKLGEVYFDRLFKKGFIEKQKNRYVITKSGKETLDAMQSNSREIV